MTHESPDTDPLLTGDGLLAAKLGERFESRPQQQEMSAAVARTLAGKGQLVVEAGTGVGKSFAYLVPAIRRIIASEGAERVVIATNTIALQEQLVSKDIPFLLGALGLNEGGLVRTELVKGRGNYVSIRRLGLASQRQEKLFANPGARRSLHQIEDWAYETEDGSLSTLPQLERPGIWDRVQSDSGNCMGRKCPSYDKCFYQSARRRMERANLLICNHAIFFSDLALRAGDAGFLPSYQHVILDEAHQVEDVASEHFGLSLSEGRVRHLLSALTQGRKSKGFLAALTVTPDGEETVARSVSLSERASDAADEQFGALLEHVGGELGSVRLRDPGALPNALTPAFRELSLVLRRLREHATKEPDKFELNAYALRAQAIADECEILIEQSMDGCVYWLETSAPEGQRRGHLRTSLACSPVDVAPVLRRELFEREISIVLTSATLTTAQSSFDHTLERLGCDGARTLALGSPFDHASLVELHVDASMPDPRARDYLDALSSRVLQHVRETDGGAFVLFTSYKTMHQVADRVAPDLHESGNPLVTQGRDGSRSQILEAFTSDPGSVLFGTSSFWQGVDVAGHTLRNVIITRLPFDPPDRPLTQARHEAIAERGGNAFADDSLPRAIIRFKQGFGRLVRTATDRGRVVVLDPRLVRSGYGRLFLKALPEGVPLVGAPTGDQTEGVA